jgi:hypothetical protein
MESLKNFANEFCPSFYGRNPQNLNLNGLNFLAQWQNFHHTGRKILPGVPTLEDAVVGAG